MAKQRRKDEGFIRAVAGAQSSSHPLARSAASGLDRFAELVKEDDLDHFLSGEVPFGFLGESDKLLSLKLSQINKHVLVIGPTGSGKTVLVMVLADALMKHINCIIFDRTGDHILAYRNYNPVVIPISNLRLNPNEPPPGVPFSEWLELYSSVLVRTLMLTDVSRGTLIQIIRYVNENFSRAGEGIYPSIYKMRLAIDEIRPRSYRDSARMQYWSRIEDRFDFMINSVIGQIFACYKSHSLEWLLSRNVVFDCRGVSAQILKIVIPILLTKIYFYRLYNQDDASMHAIILEEAEDVFGTRKGASFLENPLDDLIRRVRRGEAIIVLNQSYSTLSAALRSNVHVQFMMGSSNAYERTEMGRSIGIRGDLWEDALSLTIPYAIAAVEGKEPKLVSIPEYIIDKSRPPESVIESPDEIPYTPVDEAFCTEVRNHVLKIKKASKRTNIKKQDTEIEKIKELLLDIAKRPFMRFSDRKSLSFFSSRSKLFGVLKKASDMRLVRHVYIKISPGRGQRGLYLELTPKGYDMLVESDLWKDRTPYYAGKSGFTHALVLNELIRSYFEQKGFNTVIEGIDRGSDVDLGVLDSASSRIIGVELSATTGEKHELENIRRDLSNGWPRVLMVPIGLIIKEDVIEDDEKATGEKLEKFSKYFFDNLGPDEFRKIDFMTIREIRKEIKK